jgi:Ca-activated chloride channel homolog
MFSVRAISFRVISCDLLILAAEFFGPHTLTPVLQAQTAIDDVHILPREVISHEVSPFDREKTVAVASAALGSNAAGGLGEHGLIRTSVDLVLVPVTITDIYNRPVVGLNQDNFQLFEGKKPQEIKHFSNEDAPVSVGILVDTSASMKDKLDRAREAVGQFCDNANPQDEFFLITFADTPQLMTDFTASSENIENDLLTARSKGQTSLLDAIYMGLRKMRSARYARRALLILSDGGDNHSRYSERDVKAAIREADVMVYAVGTYDRNVATEEEALGPELLQGIAAQTGGTAFSLSTANQMAGVTRTIGTQLRHQYMLAYQPQTPPHDGKWHKINVKLLLPKKLHYLFHVEARAGYYAGGE